LSEAPPGPLHKRLLWMLAIWSASVAALAALAMLIKLALRP
jgi:hypothetical protein